MKKVVIIGSGFGGLTLAIRLQSRGLDVTLVEKNEAVGGHASQLKEKGFTFDMGPSLITAPEILRDVFDAAGERMEDYLDLIPLDPFYRVYFHDKSFLDYTGDEERMKTQMRQFNVRDADLGYDRFMKRAKALYDAVIGDRLGAKPFMTWSAFLSFAPRAMRLGAFKSSYGMAASYFEDPRHRFMFSFHPLFIGGNPFRSPAIYQMIPYLEKEGGVSFTKGGMYSLVEAFQKVFEKKGGKIMTGFPVDQIRVENGRATGVTSGEITLPADIVVSNADVLYTYKNLVPAANRKKWTDKKIKSTRVGMACYVLYLGVKRQYPQLLHHTLILSERYKELVTDIFDRKLLPDDFSMYLHAPTRSDPDMAPENGESLYVLIPVANLESGIDWDKMGPVFTDRVIQFLEHDFGLESLSENIVVKRTFTPADFKTVRNSTLGSAWGVEPKLTQTAIFRPHNRSEDIPNLYLVGAGTHPGAGVPGVLLTAETTDSVIASDLGL